MLNLNTIDPEYKQIKNKISDHRAQLIITENKLKNRDVIDLSEKINHLIN